MAVEIDRRLFRKKQDSTQVTYIIVDEFKTRLYLKKGKTNDRTERCDVRGKVCGSLERRLRRSFKYAVSKKKKKLYHDEYLPRIERAPVDHDDGIGKLLIERV